MLRSELYGALLISQSAKFMAKTEQSNKLKEGIIKYLESDQVAVLEATGISSMLDGWYDLVHDKCFMNELVDVHVENGSSFVDNNSDFYSDNYIYASYLAPGFHTFLIYSPLTN